MSRVNGVENKARTGCFLSALRDKFLDSSEFNMSDINILNYLGFATQSDFEKKYPLNSVMNHLRSFLCPNSSLTASFRIVYEYDPDWLQRQKRRILDDSDPRNSQATLGELRAYADLLGLNCEVIANGTQKGTDFSLKDRAGHTVNVEVFTMQARPKSTIDLGTTKDVWIEKDRTGKCSKYLMTTRISESIPYGIPDSNKPGDSTQANMISKICSIKADGHQAKTDIPTLLHIDFRSMEMNYTQLPHCSPFLSGNGVLTAGGNWLAFYGEEGIPIPGQQSVLDDDFVLMQHPGRFSIGNKDCFCGAFLSYDQPPHCECGHRIVFFENPERPFLPESFKRLISTSALINWELSCWQYDGFNLKAYIGIQNSRLKMVFKQFKSKCIFEL